MCECSPMSSGFTTDEIPCPQPLWWLRVVWSAKDLTPENLVLHSWHTFSLEHCIQLTLYRLINQRYLTLNRLTNNHLRMSSSTYPLSQKIWPSSLRTAKQGCIFFKYLDSSPLFCYASRCEIAVRSSCILYHRCHKMSSVQRKSKCLAYDVMMTSQLKHIIHLLETIQPFPSFYLVH